MFGRPTLKENPLHLRRRGSDAPLINTMGTIDFSTYTDEELDIIYGQVLDSLLIPPAKKEQMMLSQTKDKKIQMIQMHKDSIKDQKSQNQLNDQHKSLLSLLKAAKTPDINIIIKLRVLLSTANKDYLSSFIEANGVQIIMKCIDDRLSKAVLTELDAALLYEMLSCYKCILNNSTGMEILTQTQGLIEQIVRCLRFDWKQIAMLSLEMLSVCCFYDEISTRLVLQGMRGMAKTRNEYPFALLCNAIIECDIEVKAGVALLVNNLIMGLATVHDRANVRNELGVVQYEEKYNKTLTKVRRELDKVNLQGISSIRFLRGVANNHSIQASSKRALGPDFFPPNTIMPAGVMKDAYFTSEDCISVRHVIQANLTYKCCPQVGTMCGVLIAVKDLNKTIVGAFGMKKTKHRWFQTDGETLKWYNDEKEEGDLLITSVVDIRDYTTDANLMKECTHCFEVETPDRVVRLGCDTATDKDLWLRALTVAKDTASLKKSTYKLQSKELDENDIRLFTEDFIKQGSVFFTLLKDDREQLLTELGLDMSNPRKMADFLSCEMMAMGLTDQYTALLQELLLIPPGADTIWTAAISGLRKLRKNIIYNTMGMYNADGSGQVESMGNTTVGRDSTIKTNRDGHGEDDDSFEYGSGPGSGGSGPGYVNGLGLGIGKGPGLGSGGLTAGGSKKNCVDDGARRRSRSLGGASDPRLTGIGGLRDQELAVAPIAPSLWEGEDIMQLMKQRSADLGGAYSQVSRLALTAMNKDYEIQEMKERAIRLEGYIKGTQQLTQQDLDRIGVTAQQRKAMTEAAASFTENFARSVSTVAIADAASSAYLSRFTTGIDEERTGGKRDQGGLENYDTGGSKPGNRTGPPQLHDDPKYKEYLNMKDKMLPEGAVRHRMAKDGIPADEIEKFIASVNSGGGGPSSSGTAKDSGKSLEDNLNDVTASSEKFEKYVKMLKVLPHPVVMQKMHAAGFSEPEIKAFFKKHNVAIPDDPKIKGKEAEEEPPTGLTKKKPIVTNKKLKALFWTKIKNCDIPPTIWMRVDQDYSLSKSCRDAIDECFNAEKNAAAEAAEHKLKQKFANKGKSGVCLYDGKRTQNLLIFLSRIDIPTVDLVEIIMRLRPDELHAELTERLLSTCPTNDELNAARGYEAPQDLDPVGQYFYALGGIPRVEKRLRMHSLCFSWLADASKSSANLTVYLAACNELQASEAKFLKCLSMILALGNTLNNGTTRGQAYGVKLEAITRLSGIKANISTEASGRPPNAFAGPTLLHLVAWELATTQPDVIILFSKWQAVLAAAEVSYRQVEQDIRLLTDNIASVRSEMATGIPMMAAEGLTDASEPLKHRLTQFMKIAEPKLVEVVELKQNIATKLTSTLKLYNEQFNPSDDSVSHFFGNIVSFVKGFNQALTDNERIKNESEKENKIITNPSVSTSNTRVRRNSFFKMMDTSEKPTLRSTKGDGDKSVVAGSTNLFADYHNFQKATADKVVDNFKKKNRASMSLR